MPDFRILFPKSKFATEPEQLLAQLEASLDQLLREERRLAILRYWKKLPLAEMAEMMGLSPRTIQSLVHDSQERLRS